MKILRKLWCGQYSLAKSFWLFGFAILLVLNIPNGLMKMMSQKVIAESTVLILSYTFFIGAYQLILIFGIWRASNNYKGNKFWAFLAKSYCVIAAIGLLLGLIVIFAVKFLYGFAFIGILLFTAYWMDKKVELINAPIQKDDIPKNTIIQTSAENKKLVDDESLWDAAAKELAENKREGLWAKCFAESDGNDSLARVAYLKACVKRLNEDLLAKSSEAISEERISKVKTGLKSNVLNKELTEAKVFDERIKYSDLSVRALLDGKMYSVEKYSNKDLLLLYNGYAGCVIDSLIKVFETQELCKKAIRDGMLSTKYPKGLIVTINKETFDIY